MNGAGRRRSAISRARIGSAKAAVLPVPVCAMPRRSRPSRRCGMAWAWIERRCLVAFAVESAKERLGEAETGKIGHVLSFVKGSRRRASSMRRGRSIRMCGRLAPRNGPSREGQEARQRFGPFSGEIRSTRLERLMLRCSVALIQRDRRRVNAFSRKNQLTSTVPAFPVGLAQLPAQDLFPSRFAGSPRRSPPISASCSRRCVRASTR